MNTITTNIRRRVGLGAILAAFTLFVFGGCTADVTETGAPEIVGDWGDPELYPELGGAYAQYLTALVGTATFTSADGVLTVEGTADSAQTIIIGRRAIDNAILVNGATVTDGGTQVMATSSNVKAVDVSAAAGDTEDQVVIIDFLNGLFATATSSGGGFTVDLVAGSADDFRVRGTSGNDRFTLGSDGISFNTDTNLDATLSNVDGIDISLASGNDILSAQGGAYGTGDSPFGTLVTVWGGAGNDTLTGTDLADVINGGPDDDTIAGMGGADDLNGDAGDDTFDEGSESNGGDSFDGGEGADKVDYSARTEVITVTMGDDTANDGEAGETDTFVISGGTTSTVEEVEGGNQGDSLTGGAEDSILRGGDGDDTLVGGAGADVLYGDAGNDTFDEEDAANGGDVFNGGAGTDTVDYSGRSEDLVVTMNGSAADDGEAAEADDVNADVENLMDGSGNDVITGNNADNLFTDGGGDDSFDGGNGNDTLDAGTADDGADTFVGGAGIDTVDYGDKAGNVTVTMTSDADAGYDGLSGENDDIGDDVENCIGTDEDDGSGTEYVNDITGNDENNEITGGLGDDSLDGGAGNDILYGDAGDDTLTGGAGDDLLDGGAGSDDLDCGAGDDIGTSGGGTVTACEL